jgi:hypothetical protein
MSCLYKRHWCQKVVPMKQALIYPCNKFNPLPVKALRGMNVCGQFSFVPRYKLEPIIFQFFPLILNPQKTFYK